MAPPEASEREHRRTCVLSFRLRLFSSLRLPGCKKCPASGAPPTADVEGENDGAPSRSAVSSLADSTDSADSRGGSSPCEGRGEWTSGIVCGVDSMSLEVNDSRTELAEGRAGGGREE